MKIRKMTANFGRHLGEEMLLQDGLNVICAPNESGKSTWCAFIRAMLYGIESKEREKGGVLPDKERFKPWSGTPMEGVMEIEHAGRLITLRRATKNASAPMREFTAVYTGTEQPVPELTGADAGEILTGVSREVFRRSAFIGQGDIALTADKDMEKRIAAIVSSGDEETSYSEADARLREWQRKRRRNSKQGAIPELERQIEVNSDLLQTLSKDAEKSRGLAEELEQSKMRIDQLSQSITESCEENRLAAKERLNAAKERERELTEAHSSAAEAFAIKKERLQSGIFGDVSPEGLSEAAGADAEEAAALLKNAGRKASLLPAFAFAVLCAICLVAGFLSASPYYIAAGIFALAALVSWSRYSGIKKKASVSSAKRAEILKKYSAESEAEIYSAADAHARLWQECAEARREKDNAKAALDAAAQEHETAQLAFVSGEESESAKRISRELKDCEARAAMLSAQLSELSGRLKTLGDPMAIESGLKEMNERRRLLIQQYDALELAVSTLKEADAEMQERFSPALAGAAAKYMSRLTGGRYEELKLMRDFTALAKLSGDVLPRRAAFLSAGATDLMYLAVRLAVCDMALPEDEPCPLVLDDALVNFDPERTQRTMELLEELAKKRQIILFSCK